MELWDLVNPTAFLIAGLVFIPLERILTLRQEQKILRKHWQNDLVYVVANRILIKLGLFVTFAVFLGLTRKLVPESVHEFILSQPIWLQAIEAIIIADSGFYVAHRAFHTFPVLWRFHMIHHSIEELDWLAAHRVHPVDQIVTMTASLVPIFALGFSGPAIVIYAFIYQWQSLLIHSNVHVPFGPLKWILASPQFHHWHHGNQPEAYNRNFAGQLPFIDLLFGTLHLPKREMPKVYGIDEEVPRYYHQQFVFPFRRQSRRENAPEERIERPGMGFQ